MHPKLHADFLPGTIQGAVLIQKLHTGDLGVAGCVRRTGRCIRQIKYRLILRPLLMGVAQIQLNGLFNITDEDNLALIHDHAAVTEAANGAHIMGDVQNGSALLPGYVPHFVDALALEGHVAHRQHLVHDHNFAVQVGCHGEGQLDKHAAGIPLDGGVNKLPHLGKLDDILHFGVNFRLGHAQNRAVHIDIFPARHFAVEAGAHLQHGSHTAIEVDLPFRGSGDPAQQLQHGALASAVAADDAQSFPLVHRQIDAVEGHEGLAYQPLVGADEGIGIFPAPDSCPPALQIRCQGAAADLAQSVALFNALKAQGNFFCFHATHLLTPYP